MKSGDLYRLLTPPKKLYSTTDDSTALESTAYKILTHVSVSLIHEYKISMMKTCRCKDFLFDHFTTFAEGRLSLNNFTTESLGQYHQCSRLYNWNAGTYFNILTQHMLLQNNIWFYDKVYWMFKFLTLNKMQFKKNSKFEYFFNDAVCKIQ